MHFYHVFISFSFFYTLYVSYVYVLEKLAKAVITIIIATVM